MKLLVVKLSSMGDVLHALPTVAAIRHQTGAEIHWAVHPAFAGLVRMYRCVDHIVEIPRHGDIADHRRTLRHLRENAYDVALDLQGLFKSALVTRLARASRRIGPPFHRELSRLFYNDAPQLVRPRRHAVEECLDVLPLLGLSRPETPEFPIKTPALELPETDAFRVAIAPLSRWETKNWPLERFAETARRLHAERRAELHVLGGAGDRDTAEELRRLAGVPMRNHCGEFDIPHSCALLARMNCLLTNDSGPMHLAAAMGTPCVAVFGPTLPTRTGPYGTIHTVLRSGECAPCRKRTCRLGDMRCMAAITPDQAVEAVLRYADGDAAKHQ